MYRASVALHHFLICLPSREKGGPGCVFLVCTRFDHVRPNMCLSCLDHIWTLFKMSTNYIQIMFYHVNQIHLDHVLPSLPTTFGPCFTKSTNHIWTIFYHVFQLHLDHILLCLPTIFGTCFSMSSHHIWTMFYYVYQLHLDHILSCLPITFGPYFTMFT